MVAIFFAEGFEEIEAVTVYDIMKRAGIDVLKVGIGSNQVTGSHGLQVTVDVLIDELDEGKIEMAVLPGGMPGARNLEGSAKLASILRKLNKERKKIAAICAAPFILGKLGLLENLEAICFPGYEKYLRGAVLSRNDVVTDENVTTAKGPANAIPFSLELVRILKGEETAGILASDLQYKEC